jgi:hypothetical protein
VRLALFAARQKEQENDKEGTLSTKRLLILLIKKAIVFIRGPLLKNSPQHP